MILNMLIICYNIIIIIKECIQWQVKRNRFLESLTKKKINKKDIYKDIPLLVAVAVELLVLFIAYVILTSV